MTFRTRGLLAASSLVAALAALQACELLVNPDQLLDDAGAVLPPDDAAASEDTGTPTTVDAGADAGASPRDASAPAETCGPVLGLDGGSGLSICHYNDQVCSASGWCWRSPMPHGREIHAMWAEGGSSAWVVGEGGIILRASDTDRFESWVFSPATDLMGVGGTTDGPQASVWAVGKAGLVLHWDGERWSASRAGSGDLYGAWEHPTTGEVLVAGDQGTFTYSRSDGTWGSVEQTGKVRALSGTADGAVWAVTAEGEVVHRTAAGTWSSSRVSIGDGGPAFSFESVVAVGDSDVWLSSADGAILHWTGTVYERANCGAAVHQIAVDALGGAWVAGGSSLYRVLGTSCTGTPTGWGLGVRGAALLGENLLLGGELGLMGSALVDSGTPVFSDKANYPRYVPFSSVWARSGTEVWTGGDQGHLYEWDGTTLFGRRPANNIPTAITGLSGNDRELVAVSGANIAFQDPSGTWDGPTALACARFHAVYEAPSGQVAAPSRYDCDAGVAMPARLWLRGPDGGLPTPGPAIGAGNYGAVDGDGTGTFWVAGDEACMCSEGKCDCEAGGPSLLNAVAAIPGGTAWAVGQAGAVYTYSAGNWTPATKVTSVHLQGVWAQGEERAWAVGERATILRYDGAAWSKTDTALDPDMVELRGIHGVSGPAGTDVFAVGTRGTLLQLHVP